jgi:hypothetical protein
MTKRQGTPYPYAGGDPLVRDRRYSYSTYHGAAFFEAWESQRDAILETLPAPADEPAAQQAPAPEGDTLDGAAILAFLAGEIAIGNTEAPRVRFLLDGMVKRFEVFRRIHRAYMSDLRALDKNTFDAFPLYVDAAEVFEAAYVASDALTYLNVLIKALDSLCALTDRLSAGDQARVARLILKERAHVTALAQGAGVGMHE